MLYPEAALNNLEIEKLNTIFRLKFFAVCIVSGFCYYIFENYLVSIIVKFKKEKFDVFLKKNIRKVFNV